MTKPIGQQIKEARERLRWSQKELARQAGCSQPYIRNVEDGETSPTADKLADLGRALGVSFTIPGG